MLIVVTFVNTLLHVKRTFHFGSWPSSRCGGVTVLFLCCTPNCKDQHQPHIC